jgi:hypothetical protein
VDLHVGINSGIIPPSPTHIPHNQHFTSGYTRCPHTSNLLSQDTLTLGGLTIPGQLFSKAEDIFRTGPEWIDDDTWDGYLSLTPLTNKSPRSIPWLKPIPGNEPAGTAGSERV